MCETSPAEDLGHGVTVEVESDDVLTVSSANMDLGWRAQQGSFPGSAVRRHDQVYEVTSVDSAVDGLRRYHLRHWVEGQVIRTLTTLDRASIATLAAADRESERTRRQRTLLVALTPLTGMFPGITQMRWQRELNFPAARATTVSALIEMIIGAVGLVQAFTARPGAMFLPPALLWLIVAGPIMFAESLLRLRFAITQGEGFGSLFLWPYTLVERHRHPSAPDTLDRPVVELFDSDGGRLVLRSARGRSDWFDGGVLRFRGGTYRLRHRSGRRAAVEYHFDRAADDEPADLQLQPPRNDPPGPSDEHAIGPCAMLLRTTLMGFAPRRYQAVFFRSYGSSPTLATAATASIELLGGAFNMATRPATGVAGIADLFFLAEGLIRLALAVAQGGAVGSLLGLPFTPLFRRWTMRRG